jgi:starch synthase
MHIVMLAAEAAPLAKAGGLADVLGALPPELARVGFTISVIIPNYRLIDPAKFPSRPADGAEALPFEVRQTKLPGSDVNVFLIGSDHYFGRDGIYADPLTRKDYPDQADRWIFFQRSAMEFIRSRFSKVDILHCHDQQAALIPAYLTRFYRERAALANAGTVFTIHNLGYQGVFPPETLTRAGFDPGEFYPMSPFEFYGRMNFMKSALVFSDAVTTVSETYAREILTAPEFGYGLEGVLAGRRDPPVGIVNGIDYSTWTPSTDTLLPARYSYPDLKGKSENRKAVLRVFGLDPANEDCPLLVMISRIETQKGFDLVAATLDDLLSRNLYFILLGQGNKEIEQRLESIAARHPGRVGLRFGYNNELAHLMEAGGDIFLMPSRYEPCGLNQMYSMRYGTVPVVRATGGLADTVQEFDHARGTGTGFRFVSYDPEHFKAAVLRALAYWPDKHVWRRIMRNGMNSDFSWSLSAQRYARVYEDVRRRYPA